MRTMGLDLGTRTIGVAVSDELGLTAQPVTTLRRRSLSADLLELNRLAHAHQVERWVVGLPLNMNGTEGPKAAQAREFGAGLEKDSGYPEECWCERLSTLPAEQALLQADGFRSNQRGVLYTVTPVDHPPRGR